MNVHLYYVLNVPSTRDPVWLAQEAVAGGATVVQLRAKQMEGGEIYHLARALRSALPLHIPLFIDDRLDVALCAGADGVHVGRSDLPCAEVRRVAPGMLLGVSCYGDLVWAREAAGAGANYVAFGAVFPTTTKEAAGVVGLEVLRQARIGGLGIPVVAIGGITLANAAQVRQAGADGLAVVSAIQEAADPRQAAALLNASESR